jgi:lipooligosaccharide transport system ATP-binding protein
MDKVIDASNIVKKFGDFTAVNSINFSIGRGETFAILGENGAGKTTTMRLISARSPLTSGRLLINGLDVNKDERKIRSILGIVPQENNLDPDLNVIENLNIYSKYFRIPKDIAQKRSLELLDYVGLSNKLKSKVDALSGGMKRRLIIARALLHQPKILLLDEPTTGLDPSVRQEIWIKLEQLRRTEKITIVLSTHYMDEAEKLCNNLIVMADGEIITRGVPRDIINQKVKKLALEIKDFEELHLTDKIRNLLRNRRGQTTIFFADDIEELTPLMNQIPSRRMILRPSNLEDVFLLSITNN